MKALIRSDEDAWSLFEAIRDTKQGERLGVLRALSPALRTRYAQYEQNRMSLEHLPMAEPPLNPQQQEALRHCYDGKTIELTRLKQRIKERQSSVARAKCQYCGIDSPLTFDHYVPCSPFPEYSVYPDNLVPCCHGCNSQRGTCWRKDGDRLHINLYFDQIEEHERFLVASISFDETCSPVATFHVDHTRGKNRSFARRYERHCRELKLFERFEAAAPSRLEQIGVDARNIAKSFHQKADGIAQHLLADAAERQSLLGANNWEVALYAAAAESREFLTYCLTRAGEPS